VVRMVTPQAQAKGLAFELKTLGRMPTWVQADAKRLRQILLNLLSNAIRFTDHGEVTLRVDARREVLRFEVVDTGIGIAPQDLDRIFLPFERGSAGRRNSTPGTGLGLTITHLLTELMGGELSVQSVQGQGSVFSARLYLREIAAPAAPHGAVPTRDEASRQLRLRPVTGYEGPRKVLLVVDDQPIQRQMLAGMLLPLGFSVREAASGRECLESVRDACPDAVLLDVTMDDLDGWRTSREIRRAGHTAVPIIMVSANVFENRPENLAAAQCQAFVAKPVIESELLDTLARHLHLRWRHEPADRLHPLIEEADAPLPVPAASVVAMPATPQAAHAWIQRLSQLARIGDLQGLQDAVESLAQPEQPAPTELAQALPEWRRLIDDLDFEGLVLALRAHPLSADPDEPEEDLDDVSHG